MGATLSERYTSQQKGTVKMMTDYEKMRKDLMKVKLHLPLVEQELLTLPMHLISLVLCAIFCRSLFVLLYFFFCPFCCLFFFDIWIPITPLVSSTLLAKYCYIRFWNIHQSESHRNIIPIMQSSIYEWIHYNYFSTLEIKIRFLWLPKLKL